MNERIEKAALGIYNRCGGTRPMWFCHELAIAAVEALDK